MRSSNVQGFASKMLTLYEEEEEYEEGLSFVSWLCAHAQFNFYVSFLCSAMYYIALLLIVAKKQVCGTVAHTIFYYIKLYEFESQDFSIRCIFFFLIYKNTIENP